MTDLKEISTLELQKNPFEMVGKQWMLITAEKDGICNTMTASWGGFGVMWGKDVAYVVIRPQRYTKEFVDCSGKLSLSFLPEKHRKTLSYLGTVSGREVNKIENSELTVSYENGTPYFQEADTVLLCKKLYAQELTPDSFIDPSLDEKWYPAHDYHTLYVIEIEKVLSK